MTRKADFPIPSNMFGCFVYKNKCFPAKDTWFLVKNAGKAIENPVFLPNVLKDIHKNEK